MSEWLPKDLLQALDAGTTVRPELRAKDWQLKTRDLFSRDVADRKNLETKMRIALANNNVDAKAPAIIPSNSLSCSSHPEIESADTYKKILNQPSPSDFADSLAKAKSGISIKKQIIDNQFSGIEHDEAIQAMLQASGEDTANWVMSPTGDLGRSTKDIQLVPALLSNELDQNREFRKLAENFFNVKELDERDFFKLGDKVLDRYTLTPKTSQSCSDFQKAVSQMYEVDQPTSSTKRSTVR